ncbi:ATP-binding protein [Variovorax sp. J22R133]|uniref:ATP-binding protein n=1 Tax=Variovorax brevis TaxID=3053503 RepID=UPI002577CAA9|nr:ATP-binding protein [Variovorax sp. J22R133]MDM0117363.1 ATP-binding protein [Variovorax sp. J22R133]
MSPSVGEPDASLIVDSELHELSRVHAWVLEWAERQGLEPRVLQNLDLCSTEVVTNIVTHAGSDGPQRILLRLGWQGDVVALEVQDDGSRFDPRLMPEPRRPTSLHDAHVGGWGIPIVRRFSDDLHYRREDGRNCLTLLFRATAPP